MCPAAAAIVVAQRALFVCTLLYVATCVPGMSYGGLVGRTWRIDGNHVVSLPAASSDSCFTIIIFFFVITITVMMAPPLLTRYDFG
jgi:hypothetical protein